MLRFLYYRFSIFQYSTNGTKSGILNTKILSKGLWILCRKPFPFPLAVPSAPAAAVLTVPPGAPASVEHLAEIFLNLQAQGAHNINLVTPGQWQPWIIAALDIARTKGLHLPIVCNTGGYETVENVEAWRGYIDIWLADLKYVSSALSAELSAAPDYFAEAKPAIEAMMAQAGHPVFDADGILQKGVILRHLALPGHVKDSFAVLDQMAAWNDADPGCFLPSVMSQYTPFYKAAEHGIGRRITTYEYRRVVNYAMDKGLVQGYMQQKSSAKEEYTPSFDLTGV